MKKDVRFHINYLTRGKVEVVIIVGDAVHTITTNLQEALRMAMRLGEEVRPLSDNG